MTDGLITFKFRAELESEIVSFPGEAILVSDLKQLIEEKKQSFLKRKERESRIF